ncbi:hypothetical protein TNCV_303951 [Trichonephila clavipes]|nr:hypothetical protein TNCV_303951 [Trichonephila clavipes]
MEYLQRLEFVVMSHDLNPIGHVWNVFECSLQLKFQLPKPSMSSRKPRDFKVVSEYERRTFQLHEGFGDGHIILNHGQVTWTTPELAPPSPNYQPTPI